MGTLISNATIVAMSAEKGAEPFVGDILISNGRIAAMGAALDSPADATVIKAGRKLVMPGLVNAHTHSSEMFFRGRYERLPLELWLLYAYPLLRGEPVSKRIIYLRSMLLAIESLRGGVTTVVDHFFDPPTHDLDRLAMAVQAYDEIGIRATVASAVMNIHPLDALPFAREVVPHELQQKLAFGPRISPAAYIDYCRSAVGAFQGRSSRIGFMVAPSAPQRCSRDLLIACKDFARSAGIPYHTHVLETMTQAVTGQLIYGRSLIAYMHELGLLDAGTTLAHGVWVNDTDIDRLGAAGCSVAHNAVSNLKLGSGVAPVRRLIDAGVNVALGSDGACANDTVRMFDVMRVAGLLHGAMGTEPDKWLAAADILRMATLNGAKSARLESVTGSLEVGKAADLIVLDLDTLPFTPTNKIANHIVYAENGGSIHLVMVGGKIVLQDGHLQTIDEQDILAEIRDLIPNYLKSHGELEDANRVFHEPFAEIHRRALTSELRFDRFVPG